MVAISDLEGKDLLDIQDGNGKYISRDIIASLQKNEDVFYDWTWKIQRIKYIEKK